MTTPDARPIDPTLTVDAVLLRWPAAMPVLNAFAIDTCCGAAHSLRDAAANAGADLDELLDALATAISSGAAEDAR